MKRLLLLLCCVAVALRGAAQVHHAEYYFDTDPGFGQGILLPYNAPVADTTFTFAAGIGSLNNGLHRLYVRAYDSSKRAWSHGTPKLFYKEAVLNNPLVNIVAAEYFFDTDPGVGAASGVPVTAGQDVVFSFNGSIAALSNGLHRLFVRVQDANGKWSMRTPQLFFKSPVASPTAVNIAKAEYFFDTDPGFGSGVNVPVSAGQDIMFTFSGSIGALSHGLHRLFVRTQDAAGLWSMSAIQLFYKEAVLSNPLANITAAEYFFDTDPGFGGGNALTVTPGTDIAFPITASIASLTNGLHRLFVRSKDAAGKWSQSTTQLFYKEAVLSNPLVNIIKAEYFFDADPGVGAATDVPVTAGQDITFNFSSSIAALGNGLHRIYLRTKDANGKWSLSAPQLFFKEAVLSNPLVNITKTEYFFDTDPGIGAGVDIPVTAGQDITFTYNPSIAPLSQGAFHRLYIRSRDANGKWSMTTSQLFYIPPVPPPVLVNVTKLEYFIDNDPGFGAATNVPFTAGLDVTVNFNAGISTLSSGIHYIALRSRDANGKWSLTSTQLFYREAVLGNPLVNIIKAEYFFDADPGVGVATNVPVTAGQDITFTFNGSLAGLSNGLHRLYLRTKDAAGKWSLSAPQLFYKEAVLSNPLVNITKAEYYFDTDPGVGSGNNIPLTAGQDVNISFNGAINALPNGLHRLVVRSRDANGKWSMSAPALFYKDAIVTHTPGNLVKLEWFWDTDPGFGNATAVTIPAGNTEVQNYNFNVPVPGSFSNQMHNLYVRAQDDWGLTTVKMVDFTGIALPVTLLDFGARRDGGHVRIDWQTAVEQNMDKYVVEHSTDAQHFAAIGERKATGNNGGSNAYNLYDEQPAQGMNYYRLRQVELSGSIKYSAIASVLFSDGADDVRVYPNPASGHFSISSRTAISQVILTDMGGKTVQQYEVGSDYSLQSVPAGAYFVRVVMESGGVVTKTIVVR